MNEGDLRMGYDNVDRHLDKQAEAIVSDDAIAKDKNCPRAAAAANDFNHVLRDYREAEANRAEETGTRDEVEGDHKCAAANYEVAGADIVTDKDFFGLHRSENYSRSQGLYEDAGKNRMEAGKKEAAAKNHGEAAIDYRKAQADYKLAGDLARTEATKKGDQYDRKADGYYKKAEDARKAAEKEETASKAAEDTSKLR